MTFRFNMLAYLSLSATLTYSLIACSQQGQSERSKTYNAKMETLETLFDFDDANASYAINADSAEYAFDERSPGDNQLSVTFKSATKYARVSMVPDQPMDWSGYQDFNIAVDFENSSDVGVFIYLGIEDADGKFQNRGMSIPSNSKTTAYALLDGLMSPVKSGMNEVPPVWDNDEDMFIFRWGSTGEQLDWSNITEVNVFSRGGIADKSIKIDNVRLRANAPIPETHMTGLVDKYGQNAKVDFPIKISTDAELKAAADRELADLASKPEMPDRSKFNGWKDGPRLKATGYFRVEKVDGKWWMVDPEGYLFFSHGVANVRMANLTTITGIDFKDDSVRYVDPNAVTPEDSMGIINVSSKVRETKFETSHMRRNMFNWLPEYDHDLADHYSYRRSVHRGPVKSGETYSFYQANLERRYGESSSRSYLKKWEEVTLARMKSWGFTSFGNWVDPAFYSNQEVPYFANGWIIGDFQTLKSDMDVWGAMPDFYDPLFAERAEATISKIAEEIKGSPWCVGIFIDNEKSWGVPHDPVEKRYALMVDALSKNSSESHAKAALTTLMKDKYGDIANLNAGWNTNFNAWSDFEKGFAVKDFSGAVPQDLSLMMKAFSEQYFKIVHDTVEKHLPNHLYMGARMANWGMPEETVAAAVKYSDVMSFNIYDEGLSENGWGFFAEIDKPVVIGEFHIGAISDTGLFHPGLVMASDQTDRARMYKNYMKTVTDNPYLVGAHWFQYVDSPITGRAFDGENYNVGFVTGTDIPYPDMIDAAREIMDGLYPERYGK